MRAKLVDRDDVGMAQISGGAGFLLKPFNQVGVVDRGEYLNGNWTLYVRIEGLVDPAEPAPADLGFNLVPANGG